MPAISSPATILVTGVNGYIGAHVAHSLLTHGYTVRGTVRSESKGGPFKELFKKYGDKFHLVVVPDVIALNAYDDAVKGVAGVVHVSTPGPQVSVTDVDGKSFHQGSTLSAQSEDIRAFFRRPSACRGWNDQLVEQTEVRRFVLTSSALTCLEPKEGEYTYTEDDWFETALQIVKAQGIKTNPVLIYAASKILQERAVFDFMEKKKHRVGFDVVALLPVYVFGPPLDTFIDITRVPPGSLGLMYQAFNNPDGKDWDDLISGVDVLVDVRDVAELHSRALYTEKAGGERFIVAGDLFRWQDAWDALNVEPKLPGASVVAAGAGKQDKHRLQCSNKKSKETFDFEYRSNEEIIRDTWVDFLKRGWIKSVNA
ncbi:methylglyoxal reductase (NADPH-dependent) gre2 [Tulasnella sp. UAMH 9824]|nr:methylglyoxal reductase (NADPH-dependent) gre2 [Tulasnella sp. UAMH 9824]